MAEKRWLRQVTLSRPTGRHDGENRVAEDVFWIQEEFAKVGKHVMDEDGLIWNVKEVYGRSAVDDLDKRYAAWRRWRDVLEK